MVQLKFGFDARVYHGICMGTDMGMTVLWMGAWVGAGWSFNDWKQRQEQEYLRRLQYLVDRKERRDKWDAIYFTDASQQQQQQ